MDFSSCTACPLSEKVNHVGLPGTGNPESGLWIILDRPGYKEDNIGVSFSGTAGQFLASMLVKVGLTDENSYYLTYLTKCALPDVKDQEMKKVSTKTCFPTWLEKEIIEYKPRVIIALGNDVMSALSDQTGIIKNRGLIFDAEVGGHKFKMVPTLSPAYLLQDRRELEGQVEYDIKRAIAIYNGTDACWDDNRRNSLNYRTILTEGAFLEFYNEVKEAGIVAVDIESRGKDPYRQRTAEDNQFPLVSIQFSTKEGTAWFLPIAHETGYSEEHPDGQFWNMTEGNVVYDGLKDIFSGNWCLVIGHNFKFDSKFILKHLGIKVNLGFDTMLAHGLFEETSNSLKKIAWELTDMGGYEKAQQEYTDSLPADEQWDMFFYPWDQLMMYGCADADVTLRIFKVFDERLRKEPQLLRVFKLLIDASMAFLDIENDGIRLDTDYLTKLGIELDIEANTLEGEFKKLAFKEIMQLEEELLEAATGKSGKVLKNKPTLFNISSNSHINTLFFEKMGIPPSEKYKSKKTGEYSVGKFFLKSIEEDYPVAAKLLKHRTVSKQKAGFVDAYPEFLDENGRIHPDYKLIKFFNEESNSEQGTVSGRLACSNPNLQQVPSRGDGKRIKKLFIPDHSDHWLVDADYKGIEMRVAAMYAQDSNMKKFFNEGEGDFHRWTASQITGKKPEDVTDAERTSAKSCVPLFTQALTPTGWKSYHELSIGDNVYALDPKDKQIKLTKIKNLVKYAPTEVYKLSNGHFTAYCTEDHRWFGSRRQSTHEKGKRVRKNIDKIFFETKDITTEHTIILSGKAITTRIVDISLEEAELIGWILGDGSVKISSFSGITSQGKLGQRQGHEIKIFQTKSSYMNSLQTLCSKFGIKESIREDVGQHTFYLKAEFARDLWNRAKLLDEDYNKFILSLSPEQRMRFCQGFFFAEGHYDKRNARLVTQNKGSLADSVQLALFLEGYFPTVSESESSRWYIYKRNIPQTKTVIRYSKPYVTGQRMKKEYFSIEPVWCMETEFGTWVMKQENTICVTGNCSFGILYGAGPAKIAEQARMTEKQALKFIDQYFKLFPGLKKWINSQKKFAERNLYVRSIFGRIRHLPNAGSRNEALREAAFRRAINSPIQSDASDLTLHALTRIHKYLRNFKHFDVSKPSALRGSVHDSILLSVHDNDLTEILSVLKYKILESPDLDFIDSKGVKLGADIAIGKNWGEKEAVEI